MKSLSILIPAFNEENNLDNFIRKLLKKLNNIDYEILIINDSSTDNTESIINFLTKKYKNIKKINNKKNFGFAKSIQKNIYKVKKKYLVVLPGDGETNLRIFDYFKKKKNNNTLLFYWKKDFRKYRVYISKIYTLLINFIFNKDYIYYNGPVFYQTRELKKIKLKSSSNFFFAETILELSKNKKFNPKFIPVELPRPAFYKSGAINIYNIVLILFDIFCYKLKKY